MQIKDIQVRVETMDRTWHNMVKVRKGDLSGALAVWMRNWRNYRNEYVVVTNALTGQILAEVRKDREPVIYV